jgi:RHS repeat-associated protein
MAGISSKAIGGLENKKKYNGIEFDNDLGINTYEAFYRDLDPQIGRWWQIDPKIEEEQESFSPYSSMLNNPIRYDDPKGDCPFCAVVGAGIGAVVGGAIEAGVQLYKNGRVDNWSSVGGAAVQGGITGGVAGLTGGASLLVTVSANAGANVVGGAVNRAIQGKGTTLSDVVVDGSLGGSLAAAGKGAGVLVKNGLDKLSNSSKGVLGEAVTEIKYAARGYRSTGKAVVETGGTTPTGRVQVARYDHNMENVFTGKKLTVESKFNASDLTNNQKAAQGNVTTSGGLIVDRTTSLQLGNATQSIVTGSSGQVKND